MATIKDDISIEIFRLIPGFESYGDDQIQRIVDSIKELALIINLLPAELISENES